MQPSLYSGITHLRKCILRKRDTGIFEIVSIYKKVSSLNEFHFLIHTLILIFLCFYMACISSFVLEQ